MTSTKSPVQLVEEGKQRLELLNTKRTRAKTILETEKVRLEEALKATREQFGVSGAEELAQLIATADAENEKNSERFLAELAAAEAQQAAVDRQLQG